LRAIFSAAAHAQRAADYLHGLQGFRRGRLPARRAGPPDTIVIDGRTYSWRRLCEIRRRQLDAWKAARPQQPALFDLKDESRPVWEHNAAPSLLAAWLQVYGSCSGSTQPHL
jgi:hypothetical protein